MFLLRLFNSIRNMESCLNIFFALFFLTLSSSSLSDEADDELDDDDPVYCDVIM